MSDNPVYKFRRLKLNKSRNTYRWITIYAKIKSPSIFYSEEKIKKIEDREKIKALYLRDATIDTIECSGKMTIVIKSPNKTMILRSKKKDKENGIQSILELKESLNLGELDEEELAEIRNIIENPKNKSFYSYSTPPVRGNRNRSVSELPPMIKNNNDVVKSPRSKTPRGDSKEKKEMLKNHNSTPVLRTRSKSLSSKDSKKKVEKQEEPKTPDNHNEIEQSNSQNVKTKKRRFTFFSLRKKKTIKDDSLANIKDKPDLISSEPSKNVGSRGRSKSIGKVDKNDIIFNHEITKLKEEKTVEKEEKNDADIKENENIAKEIPKENNNNINDNNSNNNEDSNNINNNNNNNNNIKEKPSTPIINKESPKKDSPTTIKDKFQYNFKIDNDFNESEELTKFISTAPLEIDNLEISDATPNTQLDPLFEDDPHRSVKLDELDMMKKILDNMIEGTEVELV